MPLFLHPRPSSQPAGQPSHSMSRPRRLSHPARRCCRVAERVRIQHRRPASAAPQATPAPRHCCGATPAQRRGFRRTGHANYARIDGSFGFAYASSLEFCPDGNSTEYYTLGRVAKPNGSQRHDFITALRRLGAPDCTVRYWPTVRMLTVRKVSTVQDKHNAGMCHEIGSIPPSEANAPTGIIGLRGTTRTR